ncbi:MAG: hypothetical protein WC676_07635 [Candidatus Omnitrophota bacterium]
MKNFFKLSNTNVFLFFACVAVLALVVPFLVHARSAVIYVMNISLAAANSFLIFLLLTSVLHNKKTAFTWGIVFLAGILIVARLEASVTLKEFAFLFFALKSFLAFVKSDKTNKKNYIVLAVFMFGFSLLFSKKALILPAIFALYDFYFFSDQKILRVMKKWIIYAPFIVIGFAYFFLSKYPNS